MTIHIYEVTGVGTDTGRTRKKRYKARSEEAARQLALADGTDVQSIVDCGVEPPTDSQISYAKDLGITIPDGISKDEISTLIGNATRGVDPAPSNQLELATALGVTPYRFINSEDLENLIRTSLGPLKLTQWYLFLVLIRRGTSKAKQQLRSPNDPLLIKAAEELAEDSQFIESIQRNLYVLKFTGIEPNQSYAYKRATYVLKPYITTTKAKPNKPQTTRDKAVQNRNADGKDLLKSEVSPATIIWAVIFLGLLAYWFIF